MQRVTSRQAQARPVVAAAVAVHAMLHGHESSGTAGWWVGAALTAVVVVGGTYLALSRSSARLTAVVAALHLLDALIKSDKKPRQDCTGASCCGEPIER